MVPYRGVYARHLGRDQAIAEANQVLFFNAAKGYRVSHPVPEGDACLSLTISEPLLRDLPFRASLSEKVVRVAGVEPALLSELDFESSASTNSTTPAHLPPILAVAPWVIPPVNKGLQK